MGCPANFDNRYFSTFLFFLIITYFCLISIVTSSLAKLISDLDLMLTTFLIDPKKKKMLLYSRLVNSLSTLLVGKSWIFFSFCLLCKKRGNVCICLFVCFVDPLP